MAIKGLTTPVFADYTFNGSEAYIRTDSCAGPRSSTGLK